MKIMYNIHTEKLEILNSPRKLINIRRWSTDNKAWIHRRPLALDWGALDWGTTMGLNFQLFCEHDKHVWHITSLIWICYFQMSVS